MADSAASDATNDFLVPKDPKKLIAWLQNKKEQGKPRTPELQMKLNLAYMLGQQWVVWDRSANRFRRPQNRSEDANAPVRVTANKMGGIMEHFIARLTKSSPEPECRPVTDDDNDVGAAKAGTRILLHEMHRLDWETTVIDLYFWVVPIGFAYLHPVWDPDDGKSVGTISVDGADPEDIREGNIDLEIVPAFELAVDPNASSMDDARWAIRTMTMTREAVWEKWGVTPAAAEGERSLVDDVYALVDSSHDPKERSTNNVQVSRLWMLPCRAAPKGMVVTWCSSEILEEPKKFPYDHGMLPFVEWDLLPGIGTREGRTWATDLVPLQADYNDARSREAGIRRTLVPKVFYPMGSIDPRKVTSRVELIGYAPTGGEPKIHVPDSGWLAQFESAMNRADMEMGDRAGQSDVSSGKPSSASMPAAAILALQEADDTKLAVSAKLLSRATAKTARQILLLVRQYWTEKRLVRTWSEAGTLEVAQFSGADIGDQLDVHVDAGSALPRSKSARVQLAMDLLASGPPGTPMSPFADWRDVFRMLDQPGTDFITESLNVDAKQACRENDDLAQGNQREVHVWDNHVVHISEHEKFRKGETYEALEKAANAGDPHAIAVKAIVDGHIDVHYQMLQAQQQGLAEQQQPAAPPEEGGPAPQGSGKPDSPGPYLDPLTGKPPPGVEVGAGHAPSALSHGSRFSQGVAKKAGIGGPGQPGNVPGISTDQQAQSMGR